MAGARFSDAEWQRIWACLREHPGIYVGQETSTRLFLDAVLWMARAGAAWLLLPPEFGPWNSVYKRFARWQEKGVWQLLMDRLSQDGDLEWLMLDSTVVRAHACVARAKKFRRSVPWKIAGRISSKLHGTQWGAGSPQPRMARTASVTRSASP